MLNNTMPGVTDADAGCMLSPTGKCRDCARFRTMQIDLENPATGEKIPAGTLWDCVDAWTMLGVWDNGKQLLGLHAATNQAQNESNRRQDEFFDVLAGGVLSLVGTRSRLSSAPPESLPSQSEQPAQLGQSYPEPGSDGLSQDESGGDPRPIDRLSADRVPETREDQTTPECPSPVEDSDRGPSMPGVRSA